MIIILQSRKDSFEYRIEDLDGNVLMIFNDIDKAKLWLRVMRRQQYDENIWCNVPLIASEMQDLQNGTGVVRNFCVYQEKLVARDLPGENRPLLRLL